MPGIQFTYLLSQETDSHSGHKVQMNPIFTLLLLFSFPVGSKLLDCGLQLLFILSTHVTDQKRVIFSWPENFSCL